ncbi:MAG: flippase-like domain-containing protein [Chloroflexi bacterium]|nr:flippase-like domain-containing protein [Chloroflexota bacterium]
MRWRTLAMPLRIIVSVSLLIWLVMMADPKRVWAAWRAADLRLIGLALLIQLGGVALSAYKWRLLLAGRGQHQPYAWVLAAYLVGQFANNFLPTTVGGDALRVAQLGRRIGSYAEAAASVFLERLTGFVALSAIAIGGLLWSSADPASGLTTAPWLMLLTAGFAVLALAVLGGSFAAPRVLALAGPRIPPALQAPLLRIATTLREYIPSGGAFAGVIMLSFIYQGSWVLLHAVCGAALGISAPPVLYALIAPITDIVGLAPIFLNSLGAREAIFTLYLGQLGVSPAMAVALASGIFTVRLAVSGLGGLVILFGGADFRLEQHDAAP